MGAGAYLASYLVCIFTQTPRKVAFYAEHFTLLPNMTLSISRGLTLYAYLTLGTSGNHQPPPAPSPVRSSLFACLKSIFVCQHRGNVFVDYIKDRVLSEAIAQMWPPHKHKCGCEWHLRLSSTKERWSTIHGP